MFHAMRFAGFSEDGSAPLPALNLWFRATAPFQSSRSAASQQPYATYGGGPRTSLPGSSTKYYFQTNLAGTVDVVADDVFTAVALANPDDSNDIASKLLEVKAINSTAAALGARAFLDCGRLGPRFEPLYYGSGLSLGESCFEGCYGIREFAPRFLAKVTSSGVAAFARCTSLRTIDGMSAFDPCAERSFYRCASLLSLQGGFSAATTFGEKCFDGCSSLRTLSGVPSTLEELLPYCFARCTSLSDITALASTAVTELPKGCFYRCASLASPNCGAGSGITVFGESCFEDCSSLVSMAGTPAGLERADDRCFARTPVASLSGLPSTLEYMGKECYDACDLLPSLAGLPTSLTSIGERCFRGSYGEDHPAETPPEKVSTEWGLHDISRFEDVVPGMTRLEIPGGCFTGDRMIRALPDLTGLTDTLHVEPYAFSGCSGLDSLAGLPANVELKEGAFMDCFRAPHDWFELDETETPPIIVRRTRWCGLYDVDMSGWADTVTKLPARCFQGCGALAELPPLPPKLMEMGDYCFAYCTGMKNLDSLPDLDVHVVDASTHFNDGDPVVAEYPKFGEWCFAGCGTEVSQQQWVFFNNRANPPAIGHLQDIGGLVALCDRLELEGLSRMSSSSSGVMHNLLGFLYDVTVADMDSIVGYDVYTQFCQDEGGMWELRSTGDGFFYYSAELMVMAGVVETASKMAPDGFVVFTGELTEVLDASHPYASNGARHTVVGIQLPGQTSTLCNLWMCCPGVNDDVVFYDIPLNVDGNVVKEVTKTANGGSTTLKIVYTIRIEDAKMKAVSAEVQRNGHIVVNASLDRRQYQPSPTKEGQAINFMRFMVYVAAALVSKVNGGSITPYFCDDMDISSLETYVLSKLTDGGAALSALHDLNMVTPASMLSAHCFDGCSYLAPTAYPFLIEDVPPFCFANTAVASLSPFSHVRTVGAGAFMNTPLTALTGFPSKVPFVSSQAFRGCESLATAGGVPRGVSSFGSYAFAGAVALADVKCAVEDKWPELYSAAPILCKELWRASGERSAEDLVTSYPPLAAFTSARAVTHFGASCFEGDTSLSDSAFTAELEASSSATAVQRVRDALSDYDVYTSSYPRSSGMDFTIAFHLADDLDFIVRVKDDPSTSGPPKLDAHGVPVTPSSASDYAAALASVSCEQSRTGGYIYSYDGTSDSTLVALRSYDPDEYAPSESWDPEAVAPARSRPDETGFSPVSISTDGYVRLVLETEGRRFETLVSVKVDRAVSGNTVTGATAMITGVAVTDLGSVWPGYPVAEATTKYSAVPLLNSVGASCFEGCTGLGSLDWIPFGVTQFPVRCFAGVPFTHSLQYTVPVPGLAGWSSPTVDAYRDAIDDLCGSSKFYVQEIDGDNDYIPESLKLYVNWDDTDYILLNVTYTTVNGVLVPSLALDSDHAATASLNGDVTISTSGYDFPYGADAPSFGSTSGLSGPVEVLGVQGNVATLKVGALTMTFTVTNLAADSSYVSLHYTRGYVSCPPYDAMKYAFQQLQASTTAFVSDVWYDMVLGAEALRLAFDRNTGTWTATYQMFDVPVSSAANAPECEFSIWSWLTAERRMDQEAQQRFWFQATVPQLAGDTADAPSRVMYAFANVKALPVAVKANSVAVPPWVYSIGKDCFTFKGFEDAQEKLEALYIDKSPKDIRDMPNYPWGVPSGCAICSTMGGVVYVAP